jgi:hypothetical protein
VVNQIVLSRLAGGVLDSQWSVQGPTKGSLVHARKQCTAENRCTADIWVCWMLHPMAVSWLNERNCEVCC